MHDIRVDAIRSLLHTRVRAHVLYKHTLCAGSCLEQQHRQELATISKQHFALGPFLSTVLQQRAA